MIFDLRDVGMSRVITFYSWFSHDIRAGLKTITIRDKSESDYYSRERLKAYTNPENEFIAELDVIAVTPVQLSDLSEIHGKQENMSLSELRQVIRDIYPDESEFYIIEFCVADKN